MNVSEAAYFILQGEPPIVLHPIEIKALVRHRDGYRCVQCGISATEHVLLFRRSLDVHRVVPGSPYTVDGCVTLCRKCHGPQPRSPRGKRKGPRSLSIPKVFWDILEQHRLTLRPVPSMRALIEMIIEDHLKAAGLWPPAPPPAPDAKGGGQ